MRAEADVPRQDRLPLPIMTQFLGSLRKEIIDGNGVLLSKGFPVAEWGNCQWAVAYLGLGTDLGYFFFQNGFDHLWARQRHWSRIPPDEQSERLLDSRSPFLPTRRLRHCWLAMHSTIAGG